MMHTHVYSKYAHAWMEPKRVHCHFWPSWIKTHPKHVPTLLKASGFHLNPFHSKTHAFTSLETNFHQETMGSSRLTWYNPLRHQSTRSNFLGQIDQNSPNQQMVDQKSKLVKTTFFFSCFYITPKLVRDFLSTLTRG